jgi:hypothetical protein
MARTEEPWLVTCTVNYLDRNIEWFDVNVHSTFEIYPGPRIECER